MQFEEYARGWLARQDLINSTRKTTRQALDVYILPVIGDTELEENSEENIDSIFASKQLFKGERTLPSVLSGCSSVFLTN